MQSSYLPGYTFIYKSKDFNTNQLNSYCAVIKKKEKELLLKQYSELSDKIAQNISLLTQNKQKYENNINPLKNNVEINTERPSERMVLFFLTIRHPITETIPDIIRRFFKISVL